MSAAGIRCLDAHESTRVRSACALPRLAAIVEELVLNALDAGAIDVHAQVDTAAFTVSVRDNGHGIGEAGLRVIGERHATSKLASIADLDRLSTFGFRGEALHALAAISVLEIVSCSMETPHITNTVIFHHGKRLSIGAARESRSVGTTVTARDCFSNRSVSRKMLQRPGAAQAEAEVARTRLSALTIAHPSVSFSLFDSSQNLMALQSPCSSSPLARLRHSLGSTVPLPPMATFSFEDGEFALEGYVAMPPNGHRNREIQHLFVNRRPVTRRTEICRQLEAAFSKLIQLTMEREGLPAGGLAMPSSVSVHPAFVLFLSCPATLYDVTLESDKSDA